MEDFGGTTGPCDLVAPGWGGRFVNKGSTLKTTKPGKRKHAKRLWLLAACARLPDFTEDPHWEDADAQISRVSPWENPGSRKLRCPQTRCARKARSRPGRGYEECSSDPDLQPTSPI